MHPLKLRVLHLAARMAAAAAITAFAITSCNLPKPTPSGNEGSDTGGTYGTEQQEQKVYGAKDNPENWAGCDDDTWYLCMNIDITITFPNGKGNFTYSMFPGEIPCAEVKASHSGSAIYDTFKVKLAGKIDDDCVECNMQGSTAVTLTGTAYCEGSEVRGAESITINQSWADDATLSMNCTPKHEGCEVAPETPVPFKLGDQPVSMKLILQYEPDTDCLTLPLAGIMSGEISYCLYPYAVIEPIPLVP